MSWLLSKLICPSCIRLRFGPGHLLTKLTGWCP